MLKINSIIFFFMLTSCTINHEEVKKHIAWNVGDQITPQKKQKPVVNTQAFDWNTQFSRRIFCTSAVHGCIHFNRKDPLNKGLNGAFFIILDDQTQLDGLIYQLKTNGSQGIDCIRDEIIQFYRVNKYQVHLMHDQKGKYHYLLYNKKNNEIRSGEILFT
ncbi:MAG: hypothetical protein N4A35_15005 [Flavobacteriales bacterium]|jgi:hypothetical protein|nr:hypothetical protein [Flavobacteriales bacterium]